MTDNTTDKPFPLRPAWLLAALMLTCLALNLYWGNLASPTFGGFDEANHLGRIFAFAEEEMARAENVELSQPLHWPPTFHRLAAKVWLHFDRSHQALMVLWSLFLAVLLLGTYFLAKEFLDDWGALAAATLTATAPPVATYSRAITLDMPLAALTMLAFFALVRSRGFRRLGYTVAFGIAAGVSCLAKGYAPAYWLIPGLVAFFVGGSFRDLNKRGYENPLFNVAIGSVFGAFMISWWYGGKLVEWSGVLSGHMHTYRQAPGQLDGAWPLGQMIYGDFGPLLLVVVIAGVVLAWPLRRKHKTIYEMTVAVVAAAAVFASAPTTYARFLMPVLGVAATLFVAGLWRRGEARRPKVVVAVVVAASLALHVALTFAPRTAATALGMFAHPPQTDQKALAMSAQAAAHGPVVIIDDARHPYLPAGMLGYLVRRADGMVYLTVADTTRDDEVTIVDAIQDIGLAQALLLLRDKPELPFDESVLAAFTLSREAGWVYGTQRPRLQLWLRK